MITMAGAARTLARRSRPLGWDRGLGGDDSAGLQSAVALRTQLVYTIWEQPARDGAEGQGDRVRLVCGDG